MKIRQKYNDILELCENVHICRDTEPQQARDSVEI